MHQARCQDCRVPSVAVAQQSFQRCDQFNTHVARECLRVFPHVFHFMAVDVLDERLDGVRHPVKHRRKGLHVSF